MANLFTSDSLLSSIKTRALIPSSQTTYTDSDLLDLAYEELKTFIVANLIRTHEDYLVKEETSALISAQSKYRIPERAVKLRDLTYVDGNGQEIPLARIEREQEPDYVGSGDSEPRAFYLEGNHVVLVPEVGSSVSGSLNFVYFNRPGKLVTNSRYRAIVTVGSNYVTVASVPSVFTATELFDIIESKSGNETIEQDLAISSIVGTTITFTSDISGVSVGDYLCLSMEAPIPQCPEELHPLLAQRVAVRVLESLQDREGLKDAKKTLDEMEKNILAIVDNRITGKPQKIINTNFRKRR